MPKPKAKTRINRFLKGRGRYVGTPIPEVRNLKHAIKIYHKALGMELRPEQMKRVLAAWQGSTASSRAKKYFAGLLKSMREKELKISKARKSIPGEKAVRELIESHFKSGNYAVAFESIERHFGVNELYNTLEKKQKQWSSIFFKKKISKEERAKMIVIARWGERTGDAFRKELIQHVGKEPAKILSDPVAIKLMEQAIDCYVLTKNAAHALGSKKEIDAIDKKLSNLANHPA